MGWEASPLAPWLGLVKHQVQGTGPPLLNTGLVMYLVSLRQIVDLVLVLSRVSLASCYGLLACSGSLLLRSKDVLLLPSGTAVGVWALSEGGGRGAWAVNQGPPQPGVNDMD